MCVSASNYQISSCKYVSLKVYILCKIMRGTNNGSSLRMTKMSVKLLILFHILFYFDFRESLPDIESLEIQFKHKIINQQNANMYVFKIINFSNLLQNP